MLFNSPEFLFAFLPLTLLGFYGLQRWFPGRSQTYFLAAASVFFYGWWSIAHVPLLLFSIALNFTVGMLLMRQQRKALLIFGVTADLLLLGYFKYADFTTGTLNALFELNLPLPHIVLPIGISFYTFTQIAFLVDAYKAKVDDRDTGRYSLFVTFFPHLIAGPILHHREMTDQFRQFGRGKAKSDDFAIGLTIFLIGLFKKVVLADSYSSDVGQVFDHATRDGSLTMLMAWGGAAAYTFQLYFDFSGYTDMAIGLARMLGIRMPQNFFSPYKAASIADFWTRWHMTLSRFLRDYLYIPLGGNRKGFARSCVNVMITMLLGGLWHGANWTYVVWGGLHGLYIVLERLWERSGLNRIIVIPHPVAVALTFLVVLIAWVPFRAHDFAAMTAMLSAMAGQHGIGHPTVNMIKMDIIGLLIVWGLPNTQQIMARFDPVLPTGHVHDAAESPVKWRLTPRYAVALGLLAVATIMAAEGVSEFIYFQF